MCEAVEVSTGRRSMIDHVIFLSRFELTLLFRRVAAFLALLFPRVVRRSRPSDAGPPMIQVVSPPEPRC